MAQRELTVERIAVNQATFRAANEKIEATADSMALAGPVPFICECADLDCTAIVSLTLTAYEEVRQHPQRFFCAPGHQTIALDAGAGRLVAAFPSYVVVDKIGVAGEVAEQDHDRQT